MKKTSPISVDCMRFCAYRHDERDRSIEEYLFDTRHDFVAETDFDGIAVKIEACNDRFDKGARRTLSLTLVDMTTRYVVATRRFKAIVGRDVDFFNVYERFPSEMIPAEDDHAYKVVLRDETASVVLCEDIIHIYSGERYGDPTGWYKAEAGGLRVAGDLEMYKALRTEPDRCYNFRFRVSHNFGVNPPMVLPELEVRVYDAEGRVGIWFEEPQSSNSGLNDYHVGFPYLQCDEVRGICYAELLCMEYPIAGFVVDTDADVEEAGLWEGQELSPLEEYSVEAASERYRSLTRKEKEEETPDDYDLDARIDEFIRSATSESELMSDNADEESGEPEESEEEFIRPVPLLPSLDHLTGLRSVKEKLSVYERVVRFNKMRKDKGLPVSSAPLHAMFMGSPGTGKTTVAKMIGMMLRRAGVLSRGHVVVRERATLLGQYYSSEGEKTLAAIEEARGGILFIDEAYQLYQPDDARDPGKFVIETLLTALADDSNRDWMLVLAGYTDEMKRMFEMNPGFRSRIPDSNIYQFEDFTETELMDIAESYLSRQQYSLSEEARVALVDRLRADYAVRDKSFGNARHVINLIQTEILPAMAVRVTGEDNPCDNSLTEIQASDIPASVGQKQATAFRRVGFVA